MGLEGYCGVKELFSVLESYSLAFSAAVPWHSVNPASSHPLTCHSDTREPWLSVSRESSLFPRPCCCGRSLGERDRAALVQQSVLGADSGRAQTSRCVL
ncbi:hypothetical protein AAFF_G00421440 [Aldrovandia affinis]|uniref:Uncharacterized protein n=1 Tax=Aldrovandia affinis TaxID=143900 RepID=A0AAD7SC39_9TELE|nr:hypothetical protein AAFF_G00421440 [Aldrovandia affinis]